MNIDTSEFYAVAVISNPARFKTRTRLFRKFQQEMHLAGVKLLVVELAYGHRHFEVTESNNPWHLQLRAKTELWHKENLINLGVRKLSEVAPNWKYFAFLDGDISFTHSHWAEERQNWARETVHQLQHHHVIQLFQTALDLGPHGETFGKYDGFAWAYVEGKFKPSTWKYTSFHPGYAWAMRRSAYNAVGGLIEIAALGAGDRHMAYGLVGMMAESIHPGLHPSYATHLMQWQERAERYIQRDIGFKHGTIIHHWHGTKAKRQYHNRWKILVSNQYNPDTDLRRSDQGVLELVTITARQIKLRDDLRAYFRQRNEDGIDTE